MTDERPRIPNVSAKAVCEWCEDGLAVTGIRDSPRGDGFREYGPCPWCELGARLEFPTGRPGPKGERGARPAWGGDGYWQGRPAVVERAPANSAPLPHEENGLRWRLMLRRMAGEQVNPAVGVEGSDARARLEAVRAEGA